MRPVPRSMPAFRHRRKAFRSCRCGDLGSDVLARREDWIVGENPFEPGDKIVYLPAIRPDLAVFRALGIGTAMSGLASAVG